MCSFSVHIIVICYELKLLISLILDDVDWISILQVEHVFLIPAFICLMKDMKYFVIRLNSFLVKKLLDILNDILVSLLLLELIHQNVENHAHYSYQNDQK